MDVAVWLREVEMFIRDRAARSHAAAGEVYRIATEPARDRRLRVVDE